MIRHWKPQKLRWKPLLEGSGFLKVSICPKSSFSLEGQQHIPPLKCYPVNPWISKPESWTCSKTKGFRGRIPSEGCMPHSETGVSHGYYNISTDPLWQTNRNMVVMNWNVTACRFWKENYQYHSIPYIFDMFKKNKAKKSCHKWRSDLPNSIINFIQLPDTSQVLQVTPVPLFFLFNRHEMHSRCGRANAGRNPSRRKEIGWIGAVSWCGETGHEINPWCPGAVDLDVLCLDGPC